jgi:hypothetical protein
MSARQAVVDHSEARDFNNRPRRYEKERRSVEAAVEGMVRRYGLLPEMARALSEGIYELYRNLVALKSFDDQDRQYGKWWRREADMLAVRTANAPTSEVIAHIADAREFAAHMIRLETLESRNLGRGRAIEQASKITWNDLSPKERRRARLYLERTVVPGGNIREPAREVEFLRAVAGLIEQAIGRPISFSSAAPGSKIPRSGRHHGMQFDVMVAAAEIADYRLSNEAMARRIQRIRRQRSAQSSPRHS